jgi:hypothetical protein
VKPWRGWPGRGKPGMGWTVNSSNILIWGHKLKGTKKQTCLDCLYCKVSAKSTPNMRLCFCSETPKKKRHKELYWLAKKVCNEFENMGA